jgi:hypothetical protein
MFSHFDWCNQSFRSTAFFVLQLTATSNLYSNLVVSPSKTLGVVVIGRLLLSLIVCLIHSSDRFTFLLIRRRTFSRVWSIVCVPLSTTGVKRRTISRTGVRTGLYAYAQ